MRELALSFSLLCLLILAGVTTAFGQVPLPADTAERRSPDRQPLEGKPVPILEADSLKDKLEEIDTVSPLLPGKAAFYSAVLPGMGQAYNNSHWKIPLIYIGGAFIAYQVSTNHNRYSATLRNLQTLQLNTEIQTIFYAGRDRNQGDFQNLTDRFRRDRDYMIIIGGVIYALNIVEAYVDAHLQDFDLNDDLSMRLKPSLLAGTAGQPGAGIALTFHIK